MVFLIKQQSTLYTDIDIICKTMINIEQNKNVFDINGATKGPPLCNVPFNSYTHQQVDYDMTVSLGVLVLYMPNSEENHDTISSMLINKFREIGGVDRITKVPISSGNNRSTTHTLLNSCISFDMENSTTSYGSAYRKIVMGDYNIKQVCETGPRFVWSIHLIKKDIYLSIPELYSGLMKSTYLLRSISTIIYDTADIYNMPHGTKQLDYPKLNQYNMFKNNQIVPESISISQIFGLGMEITKCYYKKIPNDNTYVRQIMSDTKTVDYTKYDIRRLNPNKKWYTQLQEPFNYKEQEILENDNIETGKPPFRNDVCFITGTPLYNKVYILEVQYNGRVNKTPDSSTKSYIFIGAFTYYMSFIGTNAIAFLTLFFKINNISILQTFITNFARTEFDAINMIPNKLLHPMKKNIMLAISKNGLLSQHQGCTEVFYTVDLQKNIIYVGFLNLYDGHLVKYQNTDTVLFHLIYI
jgi:hypothetical protein